MRELRALEIAPPPQQELPGGAPRTKWEVRQSLALLGLVIALASLALAGWWFHRRPIPPPERHEADFIRSETEKLKAVQVWRYWRAMRRGLNEQRPRENRRLQEAIVRYRLKMGVTLAVALLGIGLCGGAILAGRRRSAKDPPP
jgi:hypothetical protein